MIDARALRERDWLRLNAGSRRNAAAAIRSDARRAIERAEAERALSGRVLAPLRRAQ